MENETVVNVTLDINKFLAAYSKEAFMLNVFKEALKENPQIFTDSIRDYVLADILKSGEIDKIKDSVLNELKSLIEPENIKSDHKFRSTTSRLIEEAVIDSKPIVAQVVANEINHSDFKKRVANRIGRTVEERVMQSLGEVCQGCDRDYDY